VARLILTFAALSVGVCAVAQPPKRPPQPAVVEPEEEDEAAKPVVYTLNPLQADNELRIGNFYAKKGSNKAAAKRFEEATRWNPSLSEAFLRLGETREKMSDWKAAKEAYEKYLALEPAGGKSEAIRRKLAKK
jgi:tetratricopeptide (TPR) repeat protein